TLGPDARVAVPDDRELDLFGIERAIAFECRVQRRDATEMIGIGHRGARGAAHQSQRQNAAVLHVFTVPRRVVRGKGLRHTATGKTRRRTSLMLSNRYNILLTSNEPIRDLRMMSFTVFLPLTSSSTASSSRVRRPRPIWATESSLRKNTTSKLSIARSIKCHSSTRR